MTRQTYDEWTWRHSGYLELRGTTRNRAAVEHHVAHCRAAYPDAACTLVHRTVTDWQDVAEGEVAR